MSAWETRSITNVHTDLSVARGRSSAKTVYKPPTGWSIAHFSRRKFDLADYTDNSHSAKRERRAIGYVTTYGDRRGHDIGFYTGIKVEFDYELIVHLKRETANSSVRVELPREFSVRASKLLKGDADFGGNGPHVFVQSLIGWTPKKITMVMLIQAKETKADWTTLLGDRSLTLYEAPPGLRINRFTFNGEPVGKNLSFPKMIEYIDTDHGNDNFGMFEME